MYIFRISKPLSETHTTKYKPSHSIPSSQKILRTRKIFAVLQVKKPLFLLYQMLYVYSVFLHKLHLHETPSHVFINRLKAERFLAFLICGGSLFHTFGPRTAKLFSPNFTSLALITFKCRFCWLWTGLSNDLSSMVIKETRAKLSNFKCIINWIRKKRKKSMR